MKLRLGSDFNMNETTHLKTVLQDSCANKRGQRTSVHSHTLCCYKDKLGVFKCLNDDRNEQRQSSFFYFNSLVYSTGPVNIHSNYKEVIFICVFQPQHEHQTCSKNIIDVISKICKKEKIILMLLSSI